MKKYNNGEFTKKEVGKKVTVYGWVNKRRDMGGVIFVDLRDRSGIVQVVLNKEFLKSDFALAETLKNEYCLEVTGEIKARSKEEINPNLPTGEIELIASALTILSESKGLPFNVYEDKEINEQTSLKYRYLDLRRDKLKNIMMLRHKINRAVRGYLDSHGFIDFETPILCKSTPEGARDYLVPSRVNKGYFYALPQSPQLFKQTLMISGFEKYYQIAKCFRDEDLRADRQPEFTQVDIEMSFVEQKDILAMVEELFKHVIKESIGVKIDYKFPVITYEEAMNRYGKDAPDTRFGLELQELTGILSKTSMRVFADAIENGGIAKAIVVKENKYSRNEIDRLTEFVKIYGAKGLAWLKYEKGEFSGVIAKNLEPEILAQMKKDLKVEDGDLILIVCGKPKVVFAALGALRLKIADDFKLIPEGKFNFLFVIDFPMFEYSEEDKRYYATHHPFTRPESIEMLDDPANCLSIAHDIVLNGYEVGGGSIRIHDNKMQTAVFEKLGFTEKQIQDKFGFFIEALKYGTPPHGGIALGLDRMVMLFSGTNNIRDVITFPKTQTASDMMCEAPNLVDEEQLKELGLKVVPSE